jgi:uncharacterized RDD family membrane protein YckC
MQPAPLTPAPLTKRIGAFIIDILCYIVVIWAFGHFMRFAGIEGSQLKTLLNIMALPFITVLTCWLIGNTPGKKILGLHIVDEVTGERPTVWQYFRRALLFSLVISLNILFVIPVLVTKKRKAFHDMIAGTIVIER